MTVAEYVVEQLVKQGVTDSFGIPGGVILPLLYAMNDNPSIEPHLNFHEQMAGFAACGYAQSEGRIGVAYATRGPGITNMMTCIAEAYQESVPVVFITAHGNRTKLGLRAEADQEIELVDVVSKFTKFAANVDDANAVPKVLREAFDSMLTGRKGPAFLDFSTVIWDKEIEIELKDTEEVSYTQKHDNIVAILNDIKESISSAKRPIILIGDGIRQSKCVELAHEVLSRLQIPVISSRASQDVFAHSGFYYGYVGSHGSRYTNFILSKADLIISIGNRLSFPIKSDSFRPIFESAKLIRIEVDEKEFIREIPNSINYQIDLREVFNGLKNVEYELEVDTSWIVTCNTLKKSLKNCDISETVGKIIHVLKLNKMDSVFVCDVGNNEFWFSRAFEYVRPKGNILYSKTYGTLGSSLGRAIGAYFATRKNVICIVGDQGFQYNTQELHFISMWKLPIKILLINNDCSRMIKDHEEKKYVNKYVHVDVDTGYKAPEFNKIIEAYGLVYKELSVCEEKELTEVLDAETPCVIEIRVDNDIPLVPNLPRGNACQKMEPMIDDDLYSYLNTL